MGSPPELCEKSAHCHESKEYRPAVAGFVGLMRRRFTRGGTNRRRLIVGLVGIAVLFLAEGAVSSLLARRFNDEVRHTSVTSIASVEQVARIARDVEAKRILTDEFMFDDDRRRMDEAERHMEDVRSDLRKAEMAYAPLVESPKESALSLQAQALNVEFDHRIQVLQELSRTKGAAEARARLTGLQENYGELDRTLTELIELNLAEATESIQRIDAIQRRMESARWVARIGGVFAILLFGWWGARRIIAYEEQITGYAAEIEERNRDLDSFAGRVAHDLRNSLGPIVASPLMLREKAQQPERIRAIADRIERCSDRAIAIVNALLSFSRASQKASPDECAPLERAVKDVREELAPLIGQVDASVEIDSIPNIHVRCSPGLLHVVLANVCGNAVKFLQDERERRVRLSARQEGPLCRIDVEDTGPGIAKEQQKRIFEPFFRVNGTRAQGSGIGLATVKRIVDARGGRITVESEQGRGTRFTLWLPVAPSV